MFRNRSHEDFLDKFNEMREDAHDYTFLTDYIASTAMITVLHEVCGTVFRVQPVRLTRKRSPAKCPNCSRPSTKKKTIDDIKEEVRIYGGGKFELLNDESAKSPHKLTVRHQVCGNEFQIYRNNMITWGLVCTECEKTKPATPNECRVAEVVHKRIDYLSEGKYELVNTYTGYSNLICVRNNENLEKEELPYSRFINRLKKEFPNNKVDKERERELIQYCIEKAVIVESYGRYKLLSPYRGYKGVVKVLDTQTNVIDSITYTALRARLSKMNQKNAFEEATHE